MNGTLYLIPTPLGGDDPSGTIPGPVTDRMLSLKTFVVEELRTARRYLSSCGLKGQIAGLDLHELNEHTRDEEIEALLPLFRDGNDVGLMTEAGLPAVADPGARLVALCHRHGIRVVPLSGPSSLMMALMASGMNGQSFAFLGYLPAKADERKTAVREAEKRSATLRQTQIFIETPYRNDSMLADLVTVCRPSTSICIAANLTMEDEYIRTFTASKWKDLAAKGFSIGKRPCVFLILAQR